MHQAVSDEAWGSVLAWRERVEENRLDDEASECR
jgi:hypothetical protein